MKSIGKCYIRYWYVLVKDGFKVSANWVCLRMTTFPFACGMTTKHHEAVLPRSEAGCIAGLLPLEWAGLKVIRRGHLPPSERHSFRIIIIAVIAGGNHGIK